MSGEYKIYKNFAFLPVFIRNKTRPGFIKPQYWTWMTRYTRITMLDKYTGEERTYDTIIGHDSADAVNIVDI